MKRKPTMAEILKAAAPEIKRRTDAANQELTDIGKQIMLDQQRWLDDQMKDLLPPALYEEGRHGRMETMIGEYLQKHQIQIVFIPDSLAIRIMVGKQVHSQFIPKLTIDNQPVEWHPHLPVDSSQN